VAALHVTIKLIGIESLLIGGIKLRTGHPREDVPVIVPMQAAIIGLTGIVTVTFEGSSRNPVRIEHNFSEKPLYFSDESLSAGAC
jgi:hypothetical protein